MSSAIGDQQSMSSGSNGTEKIQLGEADFTHLVIAAMGVTFHWKEGHSDARAALAEIFPNAPKADGNHHAHDYLHTREASDAQRPDLHSHILLIPTEEADRAEIFAGLDKLQEQGHLTDSEVKKIKHAITSYAASSSD